MSEILLDTCALLWLGNGDTALSPSALQVISCRSITRIRQTG